MKDIKPPNLCGAKHEYNHLVHIFPEGLEALEVQFQVNLGEKQAEFIKGKYNKKVLALIFAISVKSVFLRRTQINQQENKQIHS